MEPRWRTARKAVPTLSRVQLTRTQEEPRYYPGLAKSLSPNQLLICGGSSPDTGWQNGMWHSVAIRPNSGPQFPVSLQNSGVTEGLGEAMRRLQGIGSRIRRDSIPCHHGMVHDIEPSHKHTHPSLATLSESMRSSSNPDPLVCHARATVQPEIIVWRILYSLTAPPS
jgi:hypothetical protein